MKRLLIALWVVVFVTFFINQVAAQQCGLDVFGLNVQGQTISGKIRNTGDVPMNVTYQLSFAITNDPLIGNGTLSLSSGQEQTVSNTFTFPTGHFAVILQAQSSCGASDMETITHVVLEQFACFPPPAGGLNGQTFCDYSSQRILTCQSGSWTPTGSSEQYCFNCPLHCGDGVCSCFETASSCARDCACTQGFTNTFRCDGNVVQREFRSANCTSTFVNQQVCPLGCSNGHCTQSCQQGFVSQFVCDDNLQKQKFVSSDCSSAFLPVRSCELGCSNGFCIGGVSAGHGCDVSIENLDFVNRFQQGQSGFVSVKVRNNGASRQSINVKFFVDNVHRETKKLNITSGQEGERSFTFSSSVGVHNGEIRVEAPCGDEELRTFEIVVAGRPEEIISFSPPPSPPAPVRQTVVTVSPDRLDIPVFTGKVVGIDITSAIPQEFQISIEGVPQEFVQFDRTVQVSGEAQTFIYINPTRSGAFPFTVTVRAATEGKTFTETVDLFSVPPSGLIESFNADILILAVLWIVAILVVIAVGGTLYKKKSERKSLFNDVYRKV